MLHIVESRKPLDRVAKDLEVHGHHGRGDAMTSASCIIED
jgi:hypothetical protein